VPVEIVKFWAPWCGSCRLFAPTVERLVNERPSEFALRDVDLSRDPEEAAVRSVVSLPTLVFLVDGTEARRVVGAMSFNELSGIAAEVLEEVASARQ